MDAFEGDLPGLRVFEVDVYGDERGDFRETWNARAYADHGLDVTFVQDNLSRSKPGVLRGLHFQRPHPQGKLISVLRGTVYDAVVDIRAGSDTFGEWYGTTLSADSSRQLYVPEGFAHGFVATGSEEVLFHYKCTDFYAPEAEETILWDDPALGIEWPIQDPLLSEKDQNGALLRDVSPVPESS